MRTAVFSDVHGNLEAFRKVLEDMDTRSIDRAVCLGDTLGYGPQPQECVDLLRKRGYPSVLGNHEWGLTGKKRINWFNFQSREALERTGHLIDEETFDWFGTLPRHIVLDDAWFVHGMVPDSTTTYMYMKSAEDLVKYFNKVDERLIFVGHTHDLALAEFDGEKVRFLDLKRGLTPLKPECRYMVNCGAVGQPRDGDQHAKYVIWDNDADGAGRDTLEVRFVAYDVHKTVALFKKRGMPERYAERLLNP